MVRREEERLLEEADGEFARILALCSRYRCQNVISVEGVLRGVSLIVARRKKMAQVIGKVRHVVLSTLVARVKFLMAIKLFRLKIVRC